jgi:hypothetical protein
MRMKISLVLHVASRANPRVHEAAKPPCHVSRISPTTPSRLAAPGSHAVSKAVHYRKLAPDSMIGRKSGQATRGGILPQQEFVSRTLLDESVVKRSHIYRLDLGVKWCVTVRERSAGVEGASPPPTHKCRIRYL